MLRHLNGLPQPAPKGREGERRGGGKKRGNTRVGEAKRKGDELHGGRWRIRRRGKNEKKNVYVMIHKKYDKNDNSRQEKNMH